MTLTGSLIDKIIRDRNPPTFVQQVQAVYDSFMADAAVERLTAEGVPNIRIGNDVMVVPASMAVLS